MSGRIWPETDLGQGQASRGPVRCCRRGGTSGPSGLAVSHGIQLPSVAPCGTADVPVSVVGAGIRAKISME